MISKSESFDRVLARVYHDTSVDGLIVVVEDIDRLIQSGDLPADEGYEARLHAFRRLRELTIEDAATGRTIILRRLLPLCIRGGRGLPPDVEISLYNYREQLAGWVDQYREPERTSLRDAVLDELRPALASDTPMDACAAIAKLGFRRPDIVAALWNVVERDDGETGDVGLSTLTALGVPSSERARMLHHAHKRLRRRCGSILLGALRRLADPSSLDIIREQWLASGVDDTCADEALFAVRIVTEVADGRDEDARLQDEAWALVAAFLTAYPDRISHDIALGRDGAPRCDSGKVVSALLSMLAQADGRYRRYLLSLRLADCVRPRQLESWGTVRNSKALRRLRHDACGDTGSGGGFQTQEMLLKEAAWGVCLRLGDPSILTWFDEAVGGETNGFLRRTIMEYLACFRLTPLPRSVLEWIAERHDSEADDGSGGWAYRIAAIALARSAASRDAYEALANFGFTVRGQGLQQSADALADVAVSLARAGDSSVASEMLHKALREAIPWQRAAATQALAALAAARLLPRAGVPELLDTLNDDTRISYERAQLVTTLTHLVEGHFDDAMLAQLQWWADVDDDWLGWRSLEVLADGDYLRHMPHLLENRLGLERKGTAWDLSPSRESITWAPALIGILYRCDSQAFTPAIVSILRHRDWGEAIQVLRQLRIAQGQAREPLPGQIAEALLSRVRQRQTAVSAETDLFDALVTLLPDALGSERWDSVWEEWLPDARVALAQALGDAQYTQPQARNSATSNLVLLLGDSQYAVRRAAYRGLAQQSLDTLRVVCATWARADAAELRQRAAEAWGWVGRNDSWPEADALFELLSADSELRVRDAMDRSRREQQERRWAQGYVARVLAVEGATNDEMLAAWRYGQALTQVGDDASLRVLRTHLATSSPAPHVRHWLQSITDGVRERWSEVARQWPDPWLPWEGHVEEGQGQIVLPDGETLPVAYSLWSQRASTLSERSTWGGAVWTVPMGMKEEQLTLQLKDGRRGVAMIRSNHSDGTTIILGRDPFPTT